MGKTRIALSILTAMGTLASAFLFPSISSVAAPAFQGPTNVVIAETNQGLLLSWTPRAGAIMLAGDKAAIQVTTDFKRWNTVKTVPWWQSTQNLSIDALKYLWVRVQFQRSGKQPVASQMLRINENFRLSNWDPFVCDRYHGQEHECLFDYKQEISGEYLTSKDSLEIKWEIPDYDSFFEYQMAAPTIMEISFSTPSRVVKLNVSPNQGKATVKLTSRDYQRKYEFKVKRTYQHGQTDSSTFSIGRLPVLPKGLQVIDVVTVAPGLVTNGGIYKLVSKTLRTTSGFRCAMLFGSQMLDDMIFDQTGLGTFEFSGSTLTNSAVNSIATIRGVCWNKEFRAEIGPIRYLSEDDEEYLLTQ